MDIKILNSTNLLECAYKNKKRAVTTFYIERNIRKTERKGLSL